MVGTKTRMAFGLVLILALLAAHTATAARTIDAGEDCGRCSACYVEQLRGGEELVGARSDFRSRAAASAACAAST